MTASLADHRPPHRGGAVRGEVPHGPVAPLPVAAPLRLVPQPEGLLQIHTAPFRGSFGAVFSQALRCAGLGSRVLVCQLLKGGVAQGPGAGLRLCGRLEWLRPDTPLCIDGPAVEQEPVTRAAIGAVWAAGREQLLDGRVDQVVFDELGLAIALGYLPANEVTDTLKRRPAHVDVILTGPSMPAELMAMADQVTQLRRGL
ncbi:MAG: cob(I)yrinic acid a,c-diamide adenosyltransferase [Cyanobacteriota bacterium]|jgi:cob(I)alamin adenosyltransferase|nr:cob(I)yrinic acid a,c-diamide adenosyltransferase [Cyanobacteriota bacterium]